MPPISTQLPWLIDWLGAGLVMQSFWPLYRSQLLIYLNSQYLHWQRELEVPWQSSKFWIKVPFGTQRAKALYQNSCKPLFTDVWIIRKFCRHNCGRCGFCTLRMSSDIERSNQQLRAFRVYTQVRPRGAPCSTYYYITTIIDRYLHGELFTFAPLRLSAQSVIKISIKPINRINCQRCRNMKLDSKI